MKFLPRRSSWAVGVRLAGRFWRISGKWTFPKLNALDLAVAFGSTLATVLLSMDIAVARRALAIALLIGLQFVVTWSSVRAT